jgi:hypothetical protein
VGGPFGVPLHPLAGPEAQVDMHPECVLHMGVCLMGDMNEVEDKYGPMTAALGSGSDPQGRRRTAYRERSSQPTGMVRE